MTQASLSSILQGGDRGSIGRANRVAALILAQPKRFPELVECLWSGDPVIRMRAADAAEKASARKPELLRFFKAELLSLAGETRQQELRWHMALMIPRFPLTRLELARCIALLKEFLNDRSSIVKNLRATGVNGVSEK